MNLEQRQKFARRNPCFDARECSDPAFSFRLPAPFDDASVVLTVNVGME